MKKLQTLDFFGHKDLYVVEDEIDNDKKSIVYLLEKMQTGKFSTWERILEVNGDNVTIEVDEEESINGEESRVVKRSEIIRILGRAEISDKHKDRFPEGTIVEVGESKNTNKSSKYLEKGDICDVKDNAIIVEVLEERPLKDDEWNWDDEFLVKVLYVHILQKASYKKDTKIGDELLVKRRNLSERAYSVVHMLCPCCGHEMY